MNHKIFIWIFAIFVLTGIAYGADATEANLGRLINGTVLKLGWYNASQDNSTNKVLGITSGGNSFSQIKGCQNQTGGWGCWNTTGNSTEKFIPLVSQSVLNQTAGTTNITFSVWVNYTNSSTDNFFGPDNGARTGGIHAVWSSNRDGTFARLNLVSGGNVWGNPPNACNADPGNWTHLIFTLNVTDQLAYCWKNGNFIGSFTIAETTLTGGNGKFDFGSGPTGAGTTVGNFTAQCFTVLNVTVNTSEVLYLNQTCLPDSVVPPPPVLATPNLLCQLNGSVSNRSYEYAATLINKDYGVAYNCNITPNGTIWVDYDYLVNWTSIPGNGTIFFNVTELNITTFLGNVSMNMSLSPAYVGVRTDNNTDLLKVAFRIIGYTNNGFPTNVTIDFNLDKINEIVIPGIIRDNAVEVNEFSTSLGSNRRSQNFTFSSAGSQTITINATNSLFVKNFTMSMTGYSLDQNNQFFYTESFNKTMLPNLTLSDLTDSPLGVFDDFSSNVSGRWTTSSNNDGMAYTTDDGDNALYLTPEGSTTTTWNYIDPSADLRNTSVISMILKLFIQQGSGGSNEVFKVRATDGTNYVEFLTCTTPPTNCGHGNPAGVPDTFNYTITRLSDNGQSWSFVENTSLRVVPQTIDISSLDFTKQIKLAFSLSQVPGASSYTYLHEIDWGGVWLNRSTNNGTYKPTGNFTSVVINYTQTNVSRALLTAFDYKPANTQINYFISNTCNATNPTFESTTSGITHIFNTVGNALCVRAVLNSSVNISSPVIRKLQISVSKASGSNLSIDVGNDGNIDWNFPYEINSSNSPKTVNVSVLPFATYQNLNCPNTTTTCQYPIKVILGSSGTIAVNLLNLTQRILPEANFSGEINVVNISKLDSIGLWNWTTSFFNGVLNLYSLDVEFKGSKNITLFAHTIENGTMALNTSNLTAQIYYSKFNLTFLPVGVNYFNVFAVSRNQSNLTPYGQTNVTPIQNISNFAYDKTFDTYVKLNSTFSCVNTTFSNDSTKSDGILLSNSYQLILNNISKISNGTNLNRINESFTFTVAPATTNGSFNITINLSNSPINFLEVYNASKQLNDSGGNNWTANLNVGVVNITNGPYINGTNQINISYTYNAINLTQGWKGIWSWFDLNNCSARVVIPKANFRTFCYDCVR